MCKGINKKVQRINVHPLKSNEQSCKSVKEDLHDYRG